MYLPPWACVVLLALFATLHVMVDNVGLCNVTISIVDCFKQTTQLYNALGNAIGNVVKASP